VINVAQSIDLHDADDIWAGELSIEFKIVPAPVHTVYYFWAIYRVENLPLKDEQSVFTQFLLPYSSTGRINVF
jgi:hypothetical protein